MIIEQLDIPIIQIGSSKGIRIPKKILERLGLKDRTVAIVTENAIIIKSSIKPREGWEADFKRCREEGDDTLLISDTLDADEWDKL